MPTSSTSAPANSGVAGTRDRWGNSVGRSDIAKLLLTGQHFVGGRSTGVDIDTETGGAVALGIEIDKQRPPLVRREGRTEVDGGGGLSHPTLLVDDGDDSMVSRGTLSQRDESAPIEADERPA